MVIGTLDPVENEMIKLTPFSAHARAGEGGKAVAVGPPRVRLRCACASRTLRLIASSSPQIIGL